MTTLAEAVPAWPGLKLVEEVVEGNRNEVWRGRIRGQAVSVRRSRRSTASLDWELDLIRDLDLAGVRVATVIAAPGGRRHVDGVVVQRWLDGRPPADEADWQAAASAFRAVHRLGARPQRPGCLVVTELGRRSRSVDADVAALPDDVADELLGVLAGYDDAPVSVIHGDTAPGNVRIGSDGVAGLLDFDESRVDICWHDLSNLGVQVLDDTTHARAVALSHAWEAVNGWVVEPDYARGRLDALRSARF